jgi:hypothetical protein
LKPFFLSSGPHHAFIRNRPPDFHGPRFGGQDRAGAHACLYGGTVAAPIYPSGLSIAQLAQNFLSAPLIFLFLLGVRNQFKIK